MISRTAKKNILRILVVKPSSLGDIFHTFPAVELLRRHCPEAELDWLVHPAFSDALDYSPFPVSEKIFFRRKELGRMKSLPREFAALAGKLREKKYDLVIDFQGLFRSSIFGFLAKGALPVGFAAPREKMAGLLYGRRFRVDMTRHAVERNVALVNALFGSADAVPQLSLPLLPQYEIEIPPQFAGKKIIGVIPGARWESKKFPSAFFARLINNIHNLRPDTCFALIGTPAEMDDAAAIVAGCGDGVCFSLVGRTSVGQMIGALRNCCAVISNDSGPVHAAAALNKKVFGFFGPTVPELTGPYGQGHRIYKRQLTCLGCLKRLCPYGAVAPCHDLSSEHIATDIVQELK